MLCSNYIWFCLTIFVIVVRSSVLDRSEIDIDFELVEERVRLERNYGGGGLGGPLAAGIREKKPDKDSTPTPYAPKSNVNNSKKCEVIRTRVTVNNGPEQRASDEFDDYVKKYNKVYPNDEAKERARHVFMASKEHAYQMDQGRCSNVDARFSTTRYSDWTTDEFVQKLAGAREESDPSKLPPPFTVTEDQSRFLWKLPQMDWRTRGVIPSVRDQMQCGGCYAFATTDQLSAQEMIDKKEMGKGPVEPYSAQYFIDCMPEPYGYGCKGGRPGDVLEYMASCSDCVILIDRCYQYRNKELQCKQPSINCRNNVGAKPVISRQVNLISNREAEAMASLLRWGSVVTVVDLSPAWQYYNGIGIIREGHCGKKPNHAVLVVGYNYTGDVPYYIIKNSWSDKWGEHGYVKVEAGKNTCGIATAALVTCTSKTKCGKFKRIQDFVNNPNMKPNLKPDGTFT